MFPVKCCYRIICLIGCISALYGKIEGQSRIENEINEGTKFTLLNSRFGSRFTFSLSLSESGVRTGAGGFDMDDLTDFYIGLDDSSGNYLMRTANKPDGSSYFDNQKLNFGLTYSKIEGYTRSGLRMELEVISPFTHSRDLQDTDMIKIQTAPAFYFVIRVKNISPVSSQGNIRIALRKTAINRYNDLAVRHSHLEHHTIYFRDPGNGNSRTALAVTDLYHWNYYEDKGFTGFSRAYDLYPGEVQTDTLVYAAYHYDPIIRDLRTNQGLRFYYTHFWSNIDEVLSYAVGNADKNIGVTRRLEHILDASDAAPEEKWIAALSFHNDLACSFFLADETGSPRFYLVEGRFQHLSTIDVAHETELMAIFTPWRLRLQLDQWTRYLAYKEVLVPTNPVLNKGSYIEGYSASEMGPFLYHDVGDLPFVDETSNYNYGPHMAVEENSDFVLLLNFYWKLTGDDPFVRTMLGFTDVLLQSIMNRDTNNNGIADMGHGWTTYDVNRVLKTAPENSYLGVKQACAYITASEMFTQLKVSPGKGKGEPEQDPVSIRDGEGTTFSRSMLDNQSLREAQSLKYREEATRIINTLGKAKRKYGYIPLSLDTNTENWDQVSVVVGEGLFLPGLSGCEDPLLDKLAGILIEDYNRAYQMSLTSYGLKLSSGEDPTWFSKSMVSDLVGSYWFGTSNSTAVFAFEWNRNNPFAYNDGAFDSDTPWTGYWYPRGVCSLGYLFRSQNLVASQLMDKIKESIFTQPE